MTNQDNNRINRTDPDVLLKAIAKKSRRRGGRLYIFLGMAPGVGKTYAMLQAARDAKRVKSDIVVGVVETHGRIETERLLDGLEILPRKKLKYRDIVFDEMDIDKVLERKPSIVLVDELAHTNIPGSRHAKRWQDALEILDAGIDVFTTLNVQHLESRKDAVEEIAKITVSETVPDSLLDRAHQIQLIDLSPTDLIKRLKEGKVYLGDNVSMATSNFFKEEKLTALREIALRLTAERVDAELQTFATAREAGTFWPAAERLMVAVGHDLQSEKVIRATRRIAYNLDAPWTAVHIITTKLVSEKQKAALVKNLELARNLGAEIITAADTNLADALIRIAQQKDITEIIVGRSSRNWLRDFFGSASMADQLIKKSAIDICVIGDRPKKTLTTSAYSDLKIRSNITTISKAFLITAILTGINVALSPLIGYRAVGFIFLIGILLLGLVVPLGSVMFSAIISMIAWNFFFIPPVGTIHVTEPGDIFLCLSYLVAAFATGILTRRNKYQQEILTSREQRSQILRLILEDIATIPLVKNIIGSVTNRVAHFLGGVCDVTLMKKDRSLAPFVDGNFSFSNIDREMAVAKWVLDNNKAAGKFTETLSSAEATYIPLKGVYDVVGVLAYQDKKAHTMSVEDMDFLFVIARQLAIPLERENFRKISLATERVVESEKLHQTLLKTAAALVKNLLEHRIDEEMITMSMDNCLVASRLSVGLFPLKREPCDVRELVLNAVSKIKKLLGSHHVTIQADKSLPTLNVERELMIQAFKNILYNASQQTSLKKEIIVEILRGESEIKIIFSDFGPGVAEEHLGRIFEKFYRGIGHGAGLGLFVCKGVIKAHEGRIAALNRHEGGLSLAINLPMDMNNNETSIRETAFNNGFPR